MGPHTDDKKEPKMKGRRDLIKNLLNNSGLLLMGGIPWMAYIDENKREDFVLRPPAALSEEDFLKACIKCGICVERCPYDTLKLAKPEDDSATGTPFFIPRDVPCYMCTDIPCVEECPTDALLKDLVVNDEKDYDINKAKMGIAILDQKHCLAHWGIRCDACYRACPLMDEAISLQYERNERTGKHAMLKPVIHADKCTGCGLCEHACITEEASIIILPREKAMGKVNQDYIREWDEKDEERIDSSGVYEDINEVEQSTLDYLNNADVLFDD